MKATCYHYRNQSGDKIVGGSLPNGIDLNAAADRLIAGLDVVVMSSGRLSFADKGRPVWVYLSVDPTDTDKGKAALRAHRAQLDKDAAAAAAMRDDLDDLVDRLGIDVVLGKLKGLS
jgi:hypothetical protein